MSANRPVRIVDPHVHLWDPENTDWYPYLARFPVHEGGDPARLIRRFSPDVYQAETAGWNVDKIVNVAAATGRHSVDETIELDRRAESAESGGRPEGIIGGLPPTTTSAEAIELLDRQMEASRFRGIRSMGGPPVPDADVLSAMAERNLVFELMAHTEQLEAAAKQLSGFEELIIVVEHTGWPHRDTAEEMAEWKIGMEALARLGEHVHCKLSGLAMPFASMRVAVLRPWLEAAIEAFGVGRCFFASNFPVDAAYGTFEELYETFSDVTAGYSDDDREKMFAANAEAIYRI
jgi:L-fuconolactonase